MTTKRKYKSDAFEAIHASVKALHRVGTVGDVALSKFDEICLTTTEKIALQQLKEIDESNR